MPIVPTKEELKELDRKHKNERIESASVLSKMASDEPVSESEVSKGRKKEIEVTFSDLSDKDKLLYALAKKTECYAGADIEAICREAAILTLRKDMKAKEITSKAFDEALDKVRPSVTKEVEKAYEDLGNQFTSARGKQMKDEMPSYFG